MKKVVFIFLVWCFTKTTYSQTTFFADKIQASEVPTGGYASDGDLINTRFSIWNNSGTGWYSSNMLIGSPNGRLSVSVANEVGAAGAIAKGNVVFQMSGTNTMLFNMNTNATTAPRFVRFGSPQGGFKDLVISNQGKVGIGTAIFPLTNDGYNLYVKGGIKAEEVKVELASVGGWADYVFTPTYKLMPLTKLKSFITTNKHLPNMPSAQNLVNNGGIEISKMLKLQQEKIEENTLYVLQLNETLEALKKENEELKKRLAAIEKLLTK